RLEVLEDLAHRIHRRLAIAADDRVRRMIIVPDRTAFAQKLRLECQAEIDAGLLAALAFEDGLDLFLQSAGLHRGSDHDGVKLTLVLQRSAYLFGEPQDGAQILAAVRRRGRADANERHFTVI